jgi:hypothetical protein
LSDGGLYCWWWWSCRWCETTGLLLISQAIYKHGESWWNDIDRGNSWFVHQSSLAVLPAESTSIKVVGTGLKKLTWPYEVSLSILRKSFARAVKSYDMGPTALLPLRRKACCGLLSLSVGIEPANRGSNGKHASHYTTEDDGLNFRGV